jgi:branched-chain amino acid transport system ATP-binding protein
MLSIKNLHKSFGSKNVLNGLSIELIENKVHTLVGVNGVGKTTLFNIITGYVKPDLGKVDYNGISLLNKPPNSIAKLGISRTFQETRIAKSLTVFDNLMLALKSKSVFLPKLIDIKRVNDILEKIGFKDKSQIITGNLSYGQQKLLSIGICLITNPEWMLLDEPISGIDNINRIKIENIINELKSEGKTIFQIEHDLDYIKDISDSILFLNNGVLTTYKSYIAFESDLLVKHYYFT